MTIILVGAIWVSYQVFSFIDRANKRILNQNKRFKVLVHVAEALNSSLSREEMFQRALDITRENLDADFGEIIVCEGEHRNVWFSGIDSENCPVTGEIKMSGLKGIIMKTGEPVRLDDRTNHPASVPLPEGHPPIGPILGVPVKLGFKSIAHIILARKPGKPPFTEEDEETLRTISDDLAVSIEREMLYRKTQEMAVLKERDRVASDLHDGLLQILGSLNLMAFTIKERASQGQTPELIKSLEELRKVIKDAYEEVRKAIYDWKLNNLPNKTISEELENYIYNFSLKSNIKVSLNVDGFTKQDLPVKVKIQLMRILQEALNNVRKHSKASKVKVQLFTEEDEKVFLIEDNGKGFDVSKIMQKIENSQHFGLQNMFKRAEDIKGKLIIKSKVGSGTRIMMRFK